MDDDDPYVMKSLSMSERAEKIKTMDKDAIASASVLVDGCRMPELEDKDSGRGTGTSWRGIFPREVKSVRECENQHQRLIATATDDYFETDAIIQGQHVSSSRQFGVRRMRFAPLRPDSSARGRGGASQAGRIDVIVRQVRSIEMDEDFGYDPWIDHRHYGSSDEDEDETLASRRRPTRRSRRRSATPRRSASSARRPPSTIKSRPAAP
ncbi:hypothetical protein JL722_5640 [Aureococcus anophagefferens]|nr:hypothetical protein JL722_5640 [Aureococcus anophagefferens]